MKFTEFRALFYQGVGEHVASHPKETYRSVALKFGISETQVRRIAGGKAKLPCRVPGRKPRAKGVANVQR